ncbi:hypothetical protein CKJ84_07715 [Corynebacterium sp. NML 120412]|uniref:hypothetical protein n=1 Tax=Corynebacterium sp. NML 120412 TaxID=2029401 RepID=UPI000BAA5580|nr:hypothetical protein [Corynebacterium sp. NML 120412]PAT14629.1 hypothetical protein CKJ84_07715 [Corynebacterium sp. NML 120412]
MSHRSQFTAVLLAATSVFALSACVSGNESEEAKESEIEITTPTGAPAPEFKAEETDPLISDEITGERVEDPAMDLSYKWQGTSAAPGGGTVVVVAVTNESEVPMPADTLTPKLRYNSGNNNMQNADPMSGENAGVEIVGVDLPLGPGATTNAKYAFNVSTGNLWDAEFTIGNVTFKGNLNN